MVTRSSTCASRLSSLSRRTAGASLRRAFALAFVAGLALTACAEPPDETQPNVILVVLDNVRADRLAQCGYERPTSPFLDHLCARTRSRCTCAAQAPSNWTLPTHASYFTGVEVPQHGAGKGGQGEGNVQLHPGTHARPLDARLPTLAEHFAQAGYQTVSVSGNPLVSPPSGLTRGFQVEHHAPSFGSLYGANLREKTKAVLAERDASRPLFLFVNVADAHRPWDGIPETVGWLPPRLNLGFPQDPGEPNPLRRDFITGAMDSDDEGQLLAHLDDVYDWAVWRADETLGGILRVLRDGGWIGGTRPFRLVVTSDHGEHLGEHGLLGHAGPYLFEEITRVPLAIFSSERLADFPPEVSAIATYDLLRDGALRRRPVRSTAFASDTWPVWYGPGIGNRPAAAIWQGSEKTVHQDGRLARFDLAADPGETMPIERPTGPASDEAEALIRALESVALGEPLDAETLELLRSLGYL